MLQKDDYFRSGESEQYAFFRMPKMFFTDPMYASMSTDAKILYGLFLDRMELSRRNGWIDKEGKVYIIFTVAEMMDILNRSESQIYKVLQELDTSKKGIGLIERVRKGMGKPNVIYVKKFYTSTAIRGPDRKQACNIPETSTNVEVKTSGNVEVKNSRKTRSRPPKYGYQDLQNMEPNNTDINNTEWNKTDRDMEHPSLNTDLIGPFHNVRLSDQEINQLKGDYPYDWQDLVIRLSEYMASTGKSYQNHYATICLWAAREKGNSRKRSYACPEGESL